MKFIGLLLFPAMGFILVWMWLRVRNKNLETIVKDSAEEHHKLLDIAEQHPEGGSYSDYQQWKSQSNDTRKHSE